MYFFGRFLWSRSLKIKTHKPYASKKKPCQGSTPTRLQQIVVTFLAPIRICQLIIKIEKPPSIVPFQSYLAPPQRNLWIGIEWPYKWPRSGRILLWVSHLRVVRMRCITWPSIGRKTCYIVVRARCNRTRIIVRGCCGYVIRCVAILNCQVVGQMQLSGTNRIGNRHLGGSSS